MSDQEHQSIHDFEPKRVKSDTDNGYLDLMKQLNGCLEERLSALEVIRCTPRLQSSLYKQLSLKPHKKNHKERTEPGVIPLKLAVYLSAVNEEHVSVRLKALRLIASSLEEHVKTTLILPVLKLCYEVCRYSLMDEDAQVRLAGIELLAKVAERTHSALQLGTRRALDGLYILFCRSLTDASPQVRLKVRACNKGKILQSKTFSLLFWLFDRLWRVWY